MATTDLSCREFVELVTAYLDETLPPVERRRFEQHLGECPYCTEYLRQFRLTIQLTGRLAEESLEPAVRDDLLARFRDWNSGRSGTMGS